MRQWTPPDLIFDWDDIMIYVESAVLKQGFERYRNWHIALKRRADVLGEQLSRGGPSKRLKKG
jgi:hypothetical protein